MNERPSGLVFPNAPTVRYAVGVLLVALATAARHALSGSLHGSIPYVFNYVAVAAAALYCGLGPALVTLVLGAIVAALAFVDPGLSFGTLLFGFCAHLIGGGAVVLLGHAHSRARAATMVAVEANRRARDREAFLAETGAVLAASLDYEATLASIARLAVPFLADWCSVDVLEEDGSVRRIAITHANPAQAELAKVASTYVPDPEGKHPRTEVLRGGRSVLVPEVTDAMLAGMARDADHLQLLRAFGYRSAMIVALRARDRTLGAMTLVSAESARCYGSEDLILAEELGRRAGLALDNAHLYRSAQSEIAERRRAEQRLATQHATTRVLAEAQSLEEAVRAILAAICQSLDWEWGALWRVDRDANVLRCVEVWHPAALPFPTFERASRARTFVKGEGLPGRVWAAAAAAWIPDVTRDDNFPRAPFAACEGLRGALGFPLILGRDVLGVMEFFSREVREPDEHLREMLTTVGSQVAQFIERKGAEIAAQASEQRKRAVFESALDAIVTIDARGNITEFNPAAEAVFGYPRSAVIGREMAEVLIPPALRARHRAGLARHVATGERSIVGRRLELVAMRADGSEFSIELAITRIGTGEPALFTGFIRDITAAKTAERERTELLARESAARLEAEEANRAKDEFLATVSHELRTPLTPILLWTRMLRGGHLDGTGTARAVAAIESNAKAQAQLVDDLLDVSRIISGKLHLERQAVALAPVVEAAIQSVRLAAEAKGVQLVTDVDSEAGELLGDPNRLHQVVWNLLSNAVKFTPSGGQVDVRLTRRHHALELVVTDTGKGISREFLPHVFERFRQADSSTTRTHGGLGLGLAIVRHLVEQHGGTVEVESEGEGRGARFVARLPRFSPARSAVGEPARADKDHALTAVLAGIRVLAIDDDRDTCAAVEVVLASQGADVRTASCADAALQVLAGWRPDVLISDIAMPDVDGYQLLESVNAAARDGREPIPAIALTAHARPQDREVVLAAGFMLHLVKPIEPAALIEAVAGLIGRSVR